MKFDKIRTEVKSGNRKEVSLKRNPSGRQYPEYVRQNIEKKAYELYEQRGASHGGDWNDWFEAERLVISGLNAFNI